MGDVFVGSGGSISIKGDAAGRDIVKNYSINSFNKEKYFEIIKGYVKNIFDEIHLFDNSLEQLFVDLYTDNLNPLNSNMSNRMTVLDVLQKEKSIILSGCMGAGKSTSLLMHILDNCSDNSNPIPIIIDAKDQSFCTWIEEQTIPNIGEFATWINSVWMIQLDDIKNFDVEFIWDHMYFLTLKNQVKICELIKGLNRCFANIKHICTSRAESYGIAEQMGFIKTQIAPLHPDEVPLLIKKYNKAYQKEIASDNIVLSCAGDIQQYYNNTSQKNDDELNIQLTKFNNENFIELLKKELGVMSWKTLINSNGLSYYAIAEIITRGKSEYYAIAKNVIDNILSCNLLSYKNDRYYIGDENAILRYSAKAFNLESVREEFLKIVFERPGIIDILNYISEQKVIDNICIDIRNILKRSRAIVNNDLSMLEVAFQLYEYIFKNDKSMPQDIDAIEEIIVSMKRIRRAQLLPITREDTLEKICAKAHALMRKKDKLVFKKVNIKSTKVSLPINENWDYETSILKQEDIIYAAVTPLTLAQYQALAPNLQETTCDSIAKVRPTIWKNFSNQMVKSEFLFDPLVGVSFENANEICKAINKLIDKKDGYAYIPTIGDWAFLDTDVNQCPPVNTPPYSQNKPVACGISGINADGFTDVYGNIMEWTKSSWGGTSTDKVFNMEKYIPNGAWDIDSSPINYRLLKGGSFLFSQGSDRCSCILPPNINFPDVGFRPFFKVLDESIINANGFIEIDLTNNVESEVK